MAMTGMTPTIVLRYLNRTLGTLVQELEISEKEMMDVVFQESLFTYSKFFPYKFNIYITEKNKADGSFNTYDIPNINNLEITGIHKCIMTSGSVYGNSIVPLVSNPFDSQMIQDGISATTTPITWEFLPPNQISIKPRIVNYGKALITVKSLHPKHLKTIPLSMRDEFLTLCLCDVLISLYPLRHRFDNYNTPFGSIQPFLEMVDNAKQEREELLEKWRSNLLKASTAKRFWIG